jgi:hypothetical protein
MAFPRVALEEVTQSVVLKAWSVIRVHETNKLMWLALGVNKFVLY